MSDYGPENNLVKNNRALSIDAKQPSNANFMIQRVRERKLAKLKEFEDRQMLLKTIALIQNNKFVAPKT